MKGRYPKSIMGNPKHNLFRILLATLTLVALAACDDSTRAPGGPKGKEPSARGVDLSTAIALGVGSTPTTAGLALQSTGQTVVAVDEDGQVDELEVKEATFSDFALIDGRVFLTPSDPWSYGCALVEVIDDTELECIDDQLYEVTELQVGPDGTVYYRGMALTESLEPVEVLRKRSPAGEISRVFDLTGPMQVESWAVASDDLLYMTGVSDLAGTSEYWLRRQNANGSLTTLAARSSPQYRLIGVWPDDNLYLVDNDSNLWQIRPENDTLHEIPYLGATWDFDEVIHESDDLDLYLYDLFVGQSQPKTHDGRVLYNYDDGRGYGLVFLEFYPTPRRFESGLEQDRTITAHGDSVYFGGRVRPDVSGIVKVNTTTLEAETIYETNLELLALTITPDGSGAMFSAFDGTNNQYVMAATNLATGDTTTEPITTNLTRLEPLN